MPFALIVAGLVAVVAAAKGTQSQLGAQLVKDFTGSGNFFVWILVLAALGLIGYYAPARGLSWSLMALALLAFVLANGSASAPNGGLFNQLVSAIQNPTPSSAVANSDIPAGQSKTPASTATSGTTAPSVPTATPSIPVDPSSLLTTLGVLSF